MSAKVQLFLCILTLAGFLSVPGTRAAGGLPDTVWEQLASEDDHQILAAIGVLINNHDDGVYRLLIGLYESRLYIYEERSEQSGLVIGGESETNDDGDEMIPLESAYPNAVLLTDDAGAPLRIDSFDLIPVETNREIRAAIEAYRMRLDLTHQDPAVRIQASESLARSGKLSVLPILREAGQIDKNQEVRREIELAILRLQLQSKDSLDRFMAAEGLQEHNAIDLLPAIAVRLNPESEQYEQDQRVRERMKEASISLGNWRRIADISQMAFFGLSLGSVLILMALGLAIIYGLLGVINMAHGEFMMLGAYTAYVVYLIFSRLPVEYAELSFWAAFPLAFCLAGLIGVLVEALIIRRLYDRPLESLLATWGLGLILIQGARVIFGDNVNRPAPDFLTGGLEILPGVVLAYNRLFIIALTVFMIVGMFVLLYRTNLGLRIRAVTQNRAMSACLGIRTRNIDRTAFFLGTGIAGVAGCALTLIGNIVPNMGQNYIVDSFLVVVAGGVGKLIGTVVAGLAIGLTSKIAEPVMGAVFAKVFLLGLIVLFLQVRPTGLFPAKGRHADQ